MQNGFIGKNYSVGDGFCYEGLVYSNKKKYHFVIDCGSKIPSKIPKLKKFFHNKNDCDSRLIEISKEIRGKGQLDLFVLTHLHEDHYNGIQFLFENNIPKTVIMPYLYPEERLFLILNTPPSDSDTLAFLANPYGTVSDLTEGKSEVILLRNEDETGEKANLDYDYTQEEGPWGRNHKDSENIRRLEEFSINSNVKVITTLNRPTVRSGWCFKFFNLKIDDTYLKIIRSLYPTMTASKLLTIVQDRVQLANLKRRYKLLSQALHNDINNTSIVVFHAPYTNKGKLGTLITGDINLHYGYADKILSYFTEELHRIGMFSLPHHGSKDSWSAKFIEQGCFDDSVCVTSTHNYYPNRLDAKMMSDLRTHNILPVVVDENRFSEYVQYVDSGDDGFVHCILKPSRHGKKDVSGYFRSLHKYIPPRPMEGVYIIDMSDGVYNIDIGLC